MVGCARCRKTTAGKGGDGAVIEDYIVSVRDIDYQRDRAVSAREHSISQGKVLTADHHRVVRRRKIAQRREIGASGSNYEANVRIRAAWHQNAVNRGRGCGVQIGILAWIRGCI